MSNGPLAPMQHGPLKDGLYDAGGNLEDNDELIKDPNLDRYLKHGRRHTLGAAHNTMLANPEDMKK